MRGTRASHPPHTLAAGALGAAAMSQMSLRLMLKNEQMLCYVHAAALNCDHPTLPSKRCCCG